MNIVLVKILTICIPLVVLSIIFLCGKGSFLIAGFNTKSKAEKEKYNEKALCRFVGLLLLFIAICASFIIVSAFSSYVMITIVFSTMLLIGLSSALVYANTGSRFRLKNSSDDTISDEKNKGAHKKSVIVIAILAMIPVIVVAATIFVNELEPNVIVSGYGVEIRSTYGVSIEFEEVNNILLHENSMYSIGIGVRIDGYSWFDAETLKGNFRSVVYGDTLLFVRSSSSPTIQIERYDKADVFISLRDELNTRTLFEELYQAFIHYRTIT